MSARPTPKAPSVEKFSDAARQTPYECDALQMRGGSPPKKIQILKKKVLTFFCVSK